MPTTYHQDHSSRHFPGRIKERRRDKGGIENALVEALYEATPTSTKWDRHLTWDDCLAEFPATGLIIWFGASVDATEGSLWVFQITETQEDVENAHPTHPYSTAVEGHPVPACELLDLWDTGSTIDDIRGWVTEAGIELRYVPASVSYVSCRADAWVGPLRWVSLGAGAVVLDPDVVCRPLTIVKPLGPEYRCEVEIDGHKRELLGPRHGPLQPIGKVDWSYSKDILGRILRSARKIDKDYVRDLGLTDELMKGIVQRIDPGSQADLRLEVERLQRAASILEDVQQHRVQVENFLTELLQVPRVYAATAKAKRDAVEETLVDARKEADALRAVAAKEAAGIRDAAEKSARELASNAGEAVTKEARKAAGLRKESEQLQHEVKALRGALSSQVDALEDAVSERVAYLMNKPAEAVAESLLVRAIVEAGDRPRAHLHVLPASREDTLRIRSAEQLRKAVEGAFTARGLSPTIARVLHAGFLSGVVPVVAGRRSLDALDAYSYCATGGQSLWLPISPTTIDPVDLFGRQSQVSDRFTPHAGGLLDLLLRAEETDDLFLVILDGLNRAAVESYLLPVLACYTRRAGEHLRRELPVLHASTVPVGSGYEAAQRLRWPANVLLAGTLVDGSTVLPLPRSLWDDAALVHMGSFELDQTFAGETGRSLSPVTTVSRSMWDSWHAQPPGPAADGVLNLLHSWGVPTNERVGRFVEAVCGWGADRNAAAVAAITHIVLPNSVMVGEARRLMDLPASDERFQKTVALVQTLLNSQRDMYQAM